MQVAELPNTKEVSALNVRIKFAKHGSMKFIGHLDIMRFFQKAIIRAGLDIAYSEGYNPHQIMSFAQPLSVGVVSDGEYMDITLKSASSSADIVNRLNDVSVEGIKVLDCKLLPEKAKNSMSIIEAAKYAVYEKNGMNMLSDIDCLNEKIRSFLNKDSIIISKKTKKSETELDLKPLIYDFKAEKITVEDEDVHDQNALIFTVSAGSVANIKPDHILNAFFNEYGMEYNEIDYQVFRIDMYAKENDNFISLNDLGDTF